MAYRVAVWSTGLIGTNAIRCIARRPDFDFVGIGVYSEDKIGKDVGTLIGEEPMGVYAMSAEDLIKLKPDCIAFAGPSESANPNVVDLLESFLKAGINVSTTSHFSLMWPPSMKAETRDRLAAAARKGGVSAYANGIEPGFGGDHLSLMLTMMSDTIDTIRIQEIFRYDGAPNPKMIKLGMGFGMPMDYAAPVLNPATQIAIWGPSVHKIAHQLGETVDEIRVTVEKREAHETLQVACGEIPAGSMGAVRFETIGMIRGREAIVIEHVNRMADDIAPDWPNAYRNGTYRVLIEGNPTFQCDLVVGKPESFAHEGRVSTAMLMVNAIPQLIEAPAGLLTSLDLPFTTARHALT